MSTAGSDGGLTRMPLVPASIGEVVDRLTILDLKFARIGRDDPRQAHVANERARLRQALAEQCGLDPGELFAGEHVRELAKVNAELWDIEDGIRRCLAEECFDNEFVDLARAVPALNDRRSRLKYLISRQFGSEIIEVKSYTGFEIGEDDEQR